ncbi:MAG: hypothetical protein R2695_18615 [Acidimicrobiales bacterium]
MHEHDVAIGVQRGQPVEQERERLRRVHGVEQHLLGAGQQLDRRMRGRCLDAIARAEEAVVDVDRSRRPSTPSAALVSATSRSIVAAVVAASA